MLRQSDCPASWLRLIFVGISALLAIAWVSLARATDRPDGVSAASLPPGSPSECYLMQEGGDATLRDSCGHHDGSLSGNHYTLTSQGITWDGGGSQVKTDVTRFPRSILACFTHQFGGVLDAHEVTRTFEKYPSLLDTDDTSGKAISLEGQDGGQQGLGSANLGFLYFAEGLSDKSRYVAATKDGTNGGPHCLIVNRTASGGDAFYLDGTRMAMAYNASTGSETLGNGHLIIGGKPGDPDYWFHGTLHLLVLWDDETLTDQAKVNDALGWADAQLRNEGLPAAGSAPPTANDLQSRFLIIGDSITQCAGAPIPDDQCWAKNIQLENPSVKTVRISMGGSSGQFTSVTTPWREATLIDPRAPFNVAQFYYGINDGCRNQFSEEQVWQRAVQWSRYMHSLGVKTLFTTMIDLDRAAHCGPQNQSGSAFKNALNAIARNKWQEAFDGLVDFAAYPGLGADGASLGKCFGPDKIHPSAACQQEMIQMAEDSANYLLGDTVTYVSQNAYSMKASDKRVVVLSTDRKLATITLPSCYGKTNMPYTVSNSVPPAKGGKATMMPKAGESMFGAPNQMLEIPAGQSATVFAIVPNPSAGGCTWVTM